MQRNADGETRRLRTSRGSFARLVTINGDLAMWPWPAVGSTHRDSQGTTREVPGTILRRSLLSTLPSSRRALPKGSVYPLLPPAEVIASALKAITATRVAIIGAAIGLVVIAARLEPEAPAQVSSSTAQA